MSIPFNYPKTECPQCGTPWIECEERVPTGDGETVCSMDCLADYRDDERWLNQYEPDAEPYKGRT